MKPPLFVRRLTPKERRALETGRRSRHAFTMRRCQILLASAAGQRPSQIAQSLGCASQTVRNAIHAFSAQGLNCLQEQSRRPKSSTPIFSAPKCEQLRELLHHSPREFAESRSQWSLELVAEVCFAQGVTAHRVSHETIRQALQRLGHSWRRAQHWITSPDQQYDRKKSDATV